VGTNENRIEPNQRRIDKVLTVSTLSCVKAVVVALVVFLLIPAEACGHDARRRVGMKHFDTRILSQRIPVFGLAFSVWGLFVLANTNSMQHLAVINCL